MGNMKIGRSAERATSWRGSTILRRWRGAPVVHGALVRHAQLQAALGEGLAVARQVREAHARAQLVSVLESVGAHASAIAGDVAQLGRLVNPAATA